MKLQQITAFLTRGDKLFKTKEEAVKQMRLDVLRKYIAKNEDCDYYGYSYRCFEADFVRFYDAIMSEFKEVDEKAEAIDVLQS